MLPYPNTQEFVPPHWHKAAGGRVVNWHNEKHRARLLAKILLEQRRKRPILGQGEQATVVEIISDSIQKGEPVWHGFRVRSEAKLFRAYEIQQLASRVKRYRDEIGTHLKTHFVMGELFYRPILLGVHQAPGEVTNCFVHCGDGWEDLERAMNLPLMVPGKGPLPSTTTNEIAMDLRTLHEHVLWPSFFTDMGALVQRQSLVLIYSSSWRVLGVWALHAQGANLIDPQKMASTDFLRTVLDPMGAINDVFGAMVNLSFGRTGKSQ
jgi:hypothetical protein